MLQQYIFNLARHRFFSGNNDELFFAAGDVQITLGIQPANIAGFEEASAVIASAVACGRL